MTDEQAMKEIMSLANYHRGLKNALKVSVAAKRIGIPERRFRQLVITLFDLGENVICVPKAREKYSGFCLAGIKELRIWWDCYYTHAQTLYQRARRVSDRINLLRNSQIVGVAKGGQENDNNNEKEVECNYY